MATTASPYGLRPVRRLDGLPYAGATTEYEIATGYATNIYYGSIVIGVSDGTIAISTATGADATTNNLGGNGIGAVGVFVGCEYVNSEGQVIHSNYFPTGTTNGGANIKAKVIDDPNVLFQAQLDGALALTGLHNNVPLAAVQSTSTGNTTTGVSTTALDATSATATKAFRIVQFVSATSDAFPDVLVKFNPGYHAMTQAVGV